jgi:hypothetical protein
VNKLDSMIKQISNLPQNKDKSPEELKVLAEAALQKNEITDSTFAATPEEEKFVKEMLKKYLSQGSIETESDKETLRQLLGQELVAQRFQNLLKIQYSAANPAQDIHLIECLDQVVERISKLKQELGLSQKDRQSATWLAEWDKLKRKALNYYSTHKGCNVVKCPYCSKIFYLLLKTEHLTAETCNWFRKTDLYNQKLMEMVEKNQITRQDAADVLGVNILYVDKIYEKIYLKDKNKESEK